MSAKMSLAATSLGQISTSNYSEVKNMARDYQNTKTRLVKKLVETGAGHWVEKPVEQDQFYMKQ